MPRPNPSIANMYQDSYSRSWISSTKRKANAKVEEQIDTHIAEMYVRCSFFILKLVSLLIVSISQ